MTSPKPLILISLNEINFDIVRSYCDGADYPNLSRVAQHAVSTSSEEAYEQLEPWIQWVSVYTGKTAAEHGVFRLGDSVASQSPQIFEVLEQKDKNMVDRREDCLQKYLEKTRKQTARGYRKRQMKSKCFSSRDPR